MNNNKQLRLIAASFTPMNKKGEINLDMVDQYAKHLIDSKIDGAFICGTTGEGLSMTTEERKVVLEEWVRSANGKLKIISHVGGNSLPQSKELAAHAAKSGAFGIAALAPNFYKPENAEALVDFLAPIAGSAPDLPFYFYHIPSFTGVNLSVSEVFAIADKVIPNFAGVKYTHSDFYDMQKCIAFENGKFEVLHGFDETLICGLSLNVQAAVGSTYNYIPEVYLSLMDAYHSGDMGKAREWQGRSVKMVDILNKYGGGVRAGKAIMKFIGLDCGQCRSPIKSMSDNELRNLENDLEKEGFFKLTAVDTNKSIGSFS